MTERTNMMREAAGSVRVVHVLANTFDRGAQWMVYHLLSELGDRFHGSIISLAGKKQTEVEQHCEAGGIPIHYVDKSGGPDPAAVFRLRRLLAEHDPDVIHTHRIVLPYVLAAAYERRQSIVHTVHSPVSNSLPLSQRLLLRLGIRLGIRTVAVAHAIKEDLSKTFKTRSGTIDVIHNGIPLDHYKTDQNRRSAWREREGFAAGDLLYVCVARLSAPKNQALLINSFAGVAREDNRGKLLLVGDGPDRSELERVARTNDIGHRVYFLGNRRDIPDILSGSDIFVLSSDWEGYPLSVLEASAAGLPVVSTDVGAIDEIVSRGVTGLLVPPGDRAALQEALMRLSGDADFRMEAGRAAIDQAHAHFGLEQMANRYAKIYAKVET